MENCVAPGLDEFDVIIRSCIVFSQSSQWRHVRIAFHSATIPRPQAKETNAGVALTTRLFIMNISN